MHKKIPKLNRLRNLAPSINAKLRRWIDSEGRADMIAQKLNRPFISQSCVGLLERMSGRGAFANCNGSRESFERRNCVDQDARTEVRIVYARRRDSIPLAESTSHIHSAQFFRRDLIVSHACFRLLIAVVKLQKG